MRHATDTVTVTSVIHVYAAATTWDIQTVSHVSDININVKATTHATRDRYRVSHVMHTCVTATTWDRYWRQSATAIATTSSTETSDRTASCSPARKTQLRSNSVASSQLSSSSTVCILLIKVSVLRSANFLLPYSCNLVSMDRNMPPGSWITGPRHKLNYKKNVLVNFSLFYYILICKFMLSI